MYHFRDELCSLCIHVEGKIERWACFNHDRFDACVYSCRTLKTKTQGDIVVDGEIDQYEKTLSDEIEQQQDSRVAANRFGLPICEL
jgi:hypothetical protein